MNAINFDEDRVEILVVEDSSTQAQALKCILERHDFVVSVAGNGSEALSCMGERKPTIVMSDILMPEMDGYELCRRIKNDDRFKDLPVILLTSLSDPQDVIRGLECGADNFITKPYDEKYILSRIQYNLANKHLKDIERTQFGVEVILAGEKYFIKSDRIQILNMLLSSYEVAVQKNGELMKVRDELMSFSKKLEQKVQERTAALSEEIAERMRMEAALRKSEERYRSLAIATTQIVWTTNAEGEVADDIPMWRAFTGQSEDEVKGWRWSDALHPTDRQSTCERWAHAVVTRTLYDAEYRLRRSDGEYRYFSAHGIPVLEEDGTVREWVGACTDITDQKLAEEERKKLEEQLHHSQKIEAVGQLAGGVAHDFNNILSLIIGYANLTVESMQENDPARAYLNEVLKASGRAAALTESLLAFSRKQTVNLAVIDLNEVMKGGEKFLHRLIREDIELKISYASCPLAVMADGGQIEQVFMNLVTNARDAMPYGGKLAIEMSRTTLDQDFVQTHGFGKAGVHAVVSVADNGVGMDEQTKTRIFEPFFTTKELGKGTGLGLSMAYGIVKKHDGFINVYSEPGQGTVFRIFLPLLLDAAHPVKPEKGVPVALREGKETILLGEDDESLRRLSTKVLSHYGYRVIEAVDGLDAVSQFAEYQESVELVILDAIMPKKNGKVACEEMRALCPGLKVIFVTGYSRDLFDEEPFDENTAFIHKPFSPNQLLAQVRGLLDN